MALVEQNFSISLPQRGEIKHTTMEERLLLLQQYADADNPTGFEKIWSTISLSDKKYFPQIVSTLVSFGQVELLTFVQLNKRDYAPLTKDDISQQIACMRNQASRIERHNVVNEGTPEHWRLLANEWEEHLQTGTPIQQIQARRNVRKISTT